MLGTRLYPNPSKKNKYYLIDSQLFFNQQIGKTFVCRDNLGLQKMIQLVDEQHKNKYANLKNEMSSISKVLTNFQWNEWIVLVFEFYPGEIHLNQRRQNLNKIIKQIIILYSNLHEALTIHGNVHIENVRHYNFQKFTLINFNGGRVNSRYYIIQQSLNVFILILQIMGCKISKQASRQQFDLALTFISKFNENFSRFSQLVNLCFNTNYMTTCQLRIVWQMAFEDKQLSDELLKQQNSDRILLVMDHPQLDSDNTQESIDKDIDLPVPLVRVQDAPLTNARAMLNRPLKYFKKGKGKRKSKFGAKKWKCRCGQLLPEGKKRSHVRKCQQ